MTEGQSNITGVIISQYRRHLCLYTDKNSFGINKDILLFEINYDRLPFPVFTSYKVFCLKKVMFRHARCFIHTVDMQQ